ncbi:M16 family metallopeptidase [Nonlabens marinus]|uniref:Probable zinc protease pqqL n=1 Tax=Nonlabens marinus S1-08 TaxID=1454201 RepID=W8VSQ2_9FLAO|nr:M16 family metallopeptidase [Nonlabens marinus]BAO56405.1 probable zinc protease pqqL [Nonlabens marinus S1-08]
MKINKIYYVFLGALALACSPKMVDKPASNQEQQTSTAEETSMNTMPGMDKKIPMDPDVRMGVLDNGLTYYVKNNGKPEDKVELRLAVNAGSVLEDDDQQGLAHFMEHMNFNGTTNFEKNELVDYLQGIGVKFGADLNAYTSFDETVYILPIPSDDPEKLEKGFTILEDWAHGALLKTDAINDERGVVLEESRNGKGAGDRMNKVTIPVQFYGSKYAERLPIGKDEILKNFEPEVLKRFYNDWYRPDLMAVVAVGDLDPAVLEQKIKDHFSGIEPNKNPRERPEFNLPNHQDTKVAVAQDPEATFASINVSYKDTFESEPTSTVGDYRDDLVNGLFSFMINNRLQELTQKPNPPFIFASSSYGGTVAKNKNAYSSFAGSAPDGQLGALKAVLEENQRVKLYGFGEAELERAKAAYKSSFESFYANRDKTESGRLVGQYVNDYLNGGVTPSPEWRYETTMDLLPGIEVSEVNAKIQKYIHDDNRTIVFTGPTTENKPTEAEILKVVNEVASAEVAPYEDAVVRENLIETLPAAGSITKTETNEKLGTTTYTLSNGITVTTKKTDFKNDEILMSAYSYGGSSLYSDEDYMATVFANGGLTEAGVAGLSQTDMDKYMTGKLVNVRPSIGSTTENLSGSATPQDLETMFQLVHLYFTDLNKDEEAYSSFISKQKSFVGRMMSNPQTYFSNEVNEMRFKGNPRYAGFPDEAAYDAADYNKAYELYKERFANAGDFNFFLVGNVDDQVIMDLSKKYLANLPSTGEKEMYKTFDWKEKQGTREITVNKGTEEKSLVQMRWDYDIATYNAEEDLAVDALGEALTIRIIEVLREQEGGIYGGGARGSMSKIPEPGFNFSISFPCGPDNVEKLIAATQKEIAALKENGPSDIILNKVKEGYLLEYKEDLKSNRYWLNNLVSASREQRDPNNMMNFEAKVAKMTANDIQAVANKYLNDDYILAILMPEVK